MPTSKPKRSWDLSTIPTYSETELLQRNRNQTKVEETAPSKYFNKLILNNRYPVVFAPQNKPGKLSVNVSNNVDPSFIPLALPYCPDLNNHRYFKCKKTQCSNFSEIVILRYSTLYSFISKNKYKQIVNKLYKGLLKDDKSQTIFPEQTSIPNNKGINTILEVLKKSNRTLIYRETSKINFKMNTNEDYDDYDREESVSMVLSNMGDKIRDDTKSYVLPFKLELTNINNIESAKVEDILLDLNNLAEKEAGVYLDGVIIEFEDTANKIKEKFPVLFCQGEQLLVTTDGAINIYKDYDAYNKIVESAYRASSFRFKVPSTFKINISGVGIYDFDFLNANI